MKKIASIILSLTLLLGFSVPFAAAQDSAPVVYLDGKSLTFEVSPTIIGGSTLVPLRKIFEEQGATVDWESSTKTVTATKGTVQIVYSVGSSTATRNGETLTLTTPGQIIDGSTLVPLRFVSEALGNTVGWESNSGTIIISSAAKETAVVRRVVDGDTLDVDINGTTAKVRLIGIDTPESVHPDADRNSAEGKTASEYTKEQLTGETIGLEYDVGKTDQYGRILAYAYLESGLMYNAQLAAEGYAQQMTIQHNVKWAELFKNLIADARSNNRGLWAEESAGNTDPSGDKKMDTSPVKSEHVVITVLDYFGEVVQLQNSGSVDVEMTGWKLVSTKGNQTFYFPEGFVLKAGASIQVISGKDAADGEGKLKWTTANVHNNDGDDPVELYNAGNVKVSELK